MNLFEFPTLAMVVENIQFPSAASSRLYLRKRLNFHE